MSKNIPLGNIRIRIPLLAKIIAVYGLAMILLFFPAIWNRLSHAYYLRYHEVNSVQNADLGILGNSPESAAFEDKQDNLAVISGKPMELIIDRLDVHLNVVDGIYEAESWNVSQFDAQYATLSPLPNDDTGNTLIYGHATDAVFGKTAQLLPGDILSILTDNRHRFLYEYIGSREVLPSDTSVLYEQGDAKLTLLTCSGVLDKYRRLMEFKFMKVESL